MEQRYFFVSQLSLHWVANNMVTLCRQLVQCSQEVIGCSDEKRFMLELEFIQCLSNPQYLNCKCYFVVHYMHAEQEQQLSHTLMYRAVTKSFF